MKKIVIGFMVLVMCSITLFSLDYSTSLLLGKVIRFYGDIGVVRGFEVAEQDGRKIDIMLFKSFRTGKIKRIDVSKVDFVSFSNTEIAVIRDSNLDPISEEEYLAKIKQEKQKQENLLAEKETNKQQYNKEKYRVSKLSPFDSVFGFTWGTDKNIVKKNFPHKLTELGKKYLNTENYKLGEIPISRLTFVFDKDPMGLDSVIMRFDPDEFDSLMLVFRKKYGEPKIANVVIQNRMGAKFNQTIASWKNNNRMILFSKYGETITEGNVIFDSINTEKFQKEKEESTTKAVDQL